MADRVKSGKPNGRRVEGTDRMKRRVESCRLVMRAPRFGKQ